MKKDLSWIIFCIDRSGSMQSIQKDMIGGFNAFIKSQRDAKIGECRVFAYQFDDYYEAIFENSNLSHVPELTSKSYMPRGGTALYDALGKTIIDIGDKLSKLPENERPEKVLFVTITDGQDNAHLIGAGHVPYTAAKVKEMVQHQTDIYHWDFAYIGANQDVWAVGGSMGVASNFSYVASPVGTAYAFDNLSRSTVMYRSAAGQTKSFAFVKDDKKDIPAGAV